MSKGITVILAAALLIVAVLAGGMAALLMTRQGPEGYLTLEQARKTALTNAQVSAAQADFTATELVEVGGIPCYRLAFSANGYAYTCSINAETGEILSADYQGAGNGEALPTAGTAPATQSPSDDQAFSTLPAPSPSPTGGQVPASGSIDQARAQEIALAHAGISAADATVVKCALEYEDGRQVYEVEWYAGGAKYEYDIAVSDGAVLSSSYESTQRVGADNSASVSEADARQTALARVPGAAAEDLYEWQFGYDDGRPEYEGKIIYGGMEYEFTIDAATGAVTEWETEPLRR